MKNEDIKKKHLQRQGKGYVWFSDYGEVSRGFWFSNSVEPSWLDPLKYDKFLEILKRMTKTKR